MSKKAFKGRGNSFTPRREKKTKIGFFGWFHTENFKLMVLTCLDHKNVLLKAEKRKEFLILLGDVRKTFERK